MVEIKEKLPGVELKRTEVQADAAVAEGEAAECLAGKKSVEADLSVAMPALNAAIKVLCFCGGGGGGYVAVERGEEVSGGSNFAEQGGKEGGFCVDEHVSAAIENETTPAEK